MRAQALASSWLPRMLLALALAAAGTPAFAQTAGDPPGRVARLDHAEGAVSFLPAGDDEWVDAPRNRPITRGDQLWTDSGARAELHLGSTALRMDARTQLQFSQLDDHQARLTVPQGTASLRVRRLHAGERLQVDTPHLSFRATQAGSYRLDVNPANGTTRVTLHAGQGTVYGRSGQTLGLTAPQQLTFSGRDLAQLGAPAAPVRDDFDEWAAARDRDAERSVSGRYMSREIPGYQQLDPYGDWRMDPTYGPVWYPQVTLVGWAPYRYGHWEYIPPWGWTWIDDAPWGFAPFHYGRWVQISLRWCWVPGPIVARPVYAPALVAFVGGSSGHLLLSSRQPGLAWFPLAPGEAFRPAYRASRPYLERLNRHQRFDERDRVLRYQRQPEAVTVLPREQFGSRRTVRGESRALAPAELERGRVVSAPRFAPERRRDESETRRAPPDRIPPGWTPRQQRLESRADEPSRGRSGNRFEGRDEDARRAGPAQREQALREQSMRDQAERERRAEQEQTQRRQQAQHDQQLRQQREQEQNLRRQQQLQGEQAMRERAERQQRAEQEQAQRRQQTLHEQQLRQQREHEQNLRRQQHQQREQAMREQAERQQRAMQEQAQRQQQAQQAQQLRQQREYEHAERQQRAAERQRQHEEQRRLQGERRQRAEAEDGRR